MMPTSELISVVRTMAMGLEFSCRFLVLDMCDRLERKTKDNELLAQRYLELKHRNVKTNADRIRAMSDEELADMREFAEDVAYQFGYYCQNGGRLHITHGGLSTLEWAFDILGWENPHPVPECECEIDGCHEHATCGTPTADGYKRVCGKHFRNYCAKMDGEI